MNGAPQTPAQSPEQARAELAAHLESWVIVTLSSGRKLIGNPAGADQQGGLKLSPVFEFLTMLDEKGNWHRKVLALEMLASAHEIVVRPDSLFQLGTLSADDRAMLGTMIAAAAEQQKSLRPMQGRPMIVTGGRA